MPGHPDDPTIGLTTAPSTRAASAAPFTPGAIVAGRYRLVGLLGRGGMGEVYRADDLTLDQPVALKFLPAAFASDPHRLAQFHQELRVARQVSHKNVCRLYDIGEADGRPFITMEYVDGEDLASLLRRIGRIPQDKAVDIARQLCAGVLAAHERGVIHRDLKPANVMLDGEGKVRITDFGIATAAEDAAHVHIGTPQYMAPEQLAGKPASVASDIYALGLILFEVFTGKRVFDAKTIAELRDLHDTTTITTPSAIVRDLDPAIERVILRCLERDPARRPASALSVAAALPGSDPLAAVLAAGETPSPELLIAAGETDAIAVGRGLALLGALLVTLAIYMAVSPRDTIAALVPPEKPAAVLADRASQVLAAIGYPTPPVDSAQGFRLSGDYVRWIVQTDQSPARWAPAKVGAGPGVLFWYRTSPAEMMPVGMQPVVTATDPPSTTSGMATVVLDGRGDLQELHVRPPSHDPSPASTTPDWRPLFEAAGLNLAAFRPVAPEWTPRDYADTRAAWEGDDPRRPDVRLRIEAAAYKGRPVSFVSVGPWTRAAESGSGAGGATVLGAFSILFFIAVLLGAALVARHNVRAKRADTRTAARLGIILIALQVVVWVIGGHHIAEVGPESQGLFKAIALGALNAGFVCVTYLALEPYGRRFWPDGLLGWTRLFSGHVRDPRIGRDLLLGVALGGALMIVDVTRAMAPLAIGRPPGIPAIGFSVNSMGSVGFTAIEWEQQLYNSIQTALFIVMVLVALRLFVRRTWIAVAVTVVVVAAATSANMPAGGERLMDALFAVGAIGLITFAVFRFGLLVTVVMLAADNIVTAMPFPLHPGAWWAAPGYASAALVIAAGVFGFYAARAGQPLLGQWLEE